MFSPPVASALGAPPKSEIRTTAVAPACWALNAFSEPPQSPAPVEPLKTITTLPLSEPRRKRVAELRVGRGLVAGIGRRVELAAVVEVGGDPAGGQVGAPVLLRP